MSNHKKVMEFEISIVYNMQSLAKIMALASGINADNSVYSRGYLDKGTQITHSGRAPQLLQPKTPAHHQKSVKSYCSIGDRWYLPLAAYNA